MPGDAIKIDKTQSAAIMAQPVLNAVSAWKNAVQQVTSVRATLSHLFASGDPIDWTRVEESCGLQAGDGVTLYTFFDGTTSAINGTLQNANGKDLTERVIG